MGLANKRHNYQVNRVEVTNKASANKINVISEENQNTAVTAQQQAAAKTQDPNKQVDRMLQGANTQNLHNMEEIMRNAEKTQNMQHQQMMATLEKMVSSNCRNTNRPATGATFPGKCHNFGIYGHMASKGWKPKQQQNNQMG